MLAANAKQLKKPSTYDIKCKLFKDYMEEVQNTVLYHKKVSPQTVMALCDDYMNSDFCKWRNISTKDKQICGFIIFSRSKDEPGIYTILEAFVDKQNREQGLCKDTLKEFADNHPGVYRIRPIVSGQEAMWSHLLKSATNAMPEKQIDDCGVCLVSKM